MSLGQFYKCQMCKHEHLVFGHRYPAWLEAPRVLLQTPQPCFAQVLEWEQAFGTWNRDGKGSFSQTFQPSWEQHRVLPGTYLAPEAEVSAAKNVPLDFSSHSAFAGCCFKYLRKTSDAMESRREDITRVQEQHLLFRTPISAFLTSVAK